MLSLGQVLFKMAAMEIPHAVVSDLTQLIRPKLIIALFIYAFATILWLAVLRVTPLRQAYPFVALAFFIVPILSWFWLNEPLKITNFVGAAIIFLGVYISIS